MQKKLNSKQLATHYKKIFSDKTEKEIEELQIEELSIYFKNEMEKRNNQKSTLSLPIIDINEIMIIEFLSVFNLINDGFHYFIFKGSRGSAKTTSVVQFIILSMLIDPQASWFCIMEKKIQHSDSTMLEFKQWIDNFDKIWPGLGGMWEKVDNQTTKEWRYMHNGNMQKIKFIGLEEASRGTITPPSNNYWMGFWVEEPVSSSEQFGIDQKKKAERYKVLNTLIGSCSRFFERLPENKRSQRFIKIFTFNPYNEEDELLKDYNKLLPDNREELKTNGFQLLAHEESGKVYFTTNHRINPFLPPEFQRYIGEVRKLGGEDEKVLDLGMTGSPVNTCLADIFYILDKNKNTKMFWDEPGYTGFTGMFISIDIGKGGEGITTMLLYGFVQNQWHIIRQWGSEKWVNTRKYNPREITLSMWKEINMWKEQFIDFGNRGVIKIFLDEDRDFQTIFNESFGIYAGDWGNNDFSTHLFTDKHRKEYHKNRRIKKVKYAFTSGLVAPPSNLYVPDVIRQLKSMKTKENGDVMDGDDDYRQSAEIGIYYILQELTPTRFRELGILDKEIEKFIIDIKR